MKRWLPWGILLLSTLTTQAQIFGNKEEGETKEKFKLYQNTRGLLLGYERGRTDMLMLGYHANWKKLRLKKPVIHAVEGHVLVAPFSGVAGLQTTYWQRQGRLKWTYGGRLGALTNFSESTLSVGPVVGFRLLGLHAQAGYNLLSNPEVEANRLYFSLSLLIGSHTRIHSKKGEKERDYIKW